MRSRWVFSRKELVRLSFFSSFGYISLNPHFEMNVSMAKMWQHRMGNKSSRNEYEIKNRSINATKAITHTVYFFFFRVVNGFKCVICTVQVFSCYVCVSHLAQNMCSFYFLRMKKQQAKKRERDSRQAHWYEY